MTTLSNSKRGQLQNYMAAVVLLFVIGVSFVLGFLIFTEIRDGFIDSGLYVGQIAETGAKFEEGLKLYDQMILLIAVFTVIAIGVTTFRLASAPVFFVVTFMFGAIYGMISYFFNVVFAQMVSQPVFLFTVVNFPNTILILTNLHWVMLIYIITGSITLYAKKPKGQFLT